MLIAERYLLGPSLGRGGMGEVYRATDQALGRQVAVKLMLRTGDDTSAAERFQREARAAARLSDPHIVAVFDFGEYDDTFYLVMELVEGRSVAAELAESGPLPWERAITIVEQAAAGLAAAHAQDVVHRDIKPSNLLVAADGTVKVADFGIAHLPGAETNELTATGQILGTPHYLSPERARGLQAGPESDVYALGCVLYQLVTGRPPFVGDHPTAVLYQHVDAAPVPPGQLRPELAGQYEGLLMRMLAKSPEQRPTAAQLTVFPLAAELFPTAPLAVDPSTSPLAPTPASPVDPTPTPAAPPAAPPGGEPVAEPSGRRKPLLIAAAAVLVLAGAIAAGVVLRNTGDNLPSTVDVGPNPSTSAGTPSTPATTTPARTTEPSQAGQVDRTTRNTPATTPSSTPTTTPATPTPTAPTTTAPSSSTTPSSPTPTPTKSSSPTPSSTPTSSAPPPSPTPKPSDTPAPTDTPTP
ncbi:MAG TPA: serine/threonine-protein kinase [Kribbella sp.]